jgi:hypothetical protein
VIAGASSLAKEAWAEARDELGVSSKCRVVVKTVDRRGKSAIPASRMEIEESRREREERRDETEAEREVAVEDAYGADIVGRVVLMVLFVVRFCYPIRSCDVDSGMMRLQN